jgi:nitrous oxidase accessory protein NosD
MYLNKFRTNANNAYSTEYSNVWYTYNGNTYTNYTGTDGNGEGLDDSPYRIDSDKDEHPLMMPWQIYLTALFRT